LALNCRPVSADTLTEMDSHAKTAKLKKVLVIGGSVGVLALLAAGGGYWYSKKPSGHSPSEESHQAVHASPKPTFWQGIQAKVEEIAAALDENDRLRLENMKLKAEIAQRDFDEQSQVASEITEHYGISLKEKTGTPTGRSLASISYSPPSHLLPKQLYTLGVDYFKKQDFEKAAVIFSFLSDLKGSDEFKTAKNFVMTGVAWYKLNNYASATEFFDRALEQKSSELNKEYLAKARLWKGIVADRLGQTSQSQKWLYDLIAKHPHSAEASWINGKPKTPAIPKQAHAETPHEAPAQIEEAQNEKTEEAHREPAHSH
jgi:tetratricopeptide (TPR) repeat protein